MYKIQFVNAVNMYYGNSLTKSKSDSRLFYVHKVYISIVHAVMLM
jgi:hypothetical protein